MIVSELERILSNYDGDCEVVFVLHPYRGSTAVLDICEHDCIECDDPDAPITEDDEDITKPVVAMQVMDHADDYTPADGCSWPGRS